MASRRSSASAPADAELLLPRPPGVIRQFWARHPLFTDIVVTLIGLLIAVTTAGPFGTDGADPGAAVHVVSMVIAIAAAASLMLRRRWPLLPYALAVLLQLVMLAYPSAAGSPLLILAMYAVAVYGSSRLCWIAYGVGMGAIALVGALSVLVGAVDLQAALNALLAAAVVALVGAGPAGAPRQRQSRGAGHGDDHREAPLPGDVHASSSSSAASIDLDAASE